VRRDEADLEFAELRGALKGGQTRDDLERHIGMCSSCKSGAHFSSKNQASPELLEDHASMLNDPYAGLAATGRRRGFGP
jgi:hypothetical protein